MIEGKFIIKMKPASDVSIQSVTDEAIASIAAGADHVYSNLGGFAATLTAEEVEFLRDNPAVSLVLL